MLSPLAVEMYCSSQIQIRWRGLKSTIWSQQKPPADAGKRVNGSRKVQFVPASVEVEANQFPVIMSWRSLAAAVGSQMVEVRSLVAVSSSPRFWTSVRGMSALLYGSLGSVGSGIT